MTKKKKVLVIAYNFPPANTIGSLRMLRMVKRFSGLGYDTHVLTVNEDLASFPNPSLINEVPPEVKVTRVWMFDPSQIGRKVIGMVRARATGGAAARLSGGGSMSRVARFMRRYILMPDEIVGWTPFAIRAGKKLLERERFDLIFASMPPLTDFVIAWNLKRQSGLPLVCEYRDNWNIVSVMPQELSNFRLRVIGAVERKMIPDMDHVIAVTRSIGNELLERYPYLLPGHLSIIYNCFEPDEYPKTVPPRGEKLNITYTGGITPYRDAFPLFTAIAKLGKDGLIQPAKIAIHIYGQYSSLDFGAAAKEAGVELIQHGMVPYQEIPGILTRADVLLLVKNPEDKAHIPGKLFEYIGARRPILMLGPEDSEAAEIINSYKLGEVAFQKDPQKIEAAILSLYRTWDQGETKSPPAITIPGQFTSAGMAAAVAHAFEQAVTNPTVFQPGTPPVKRKASLNSLCDHPARIIALTWLREVAKVALGVISYYSQARKFLDRLAVRQGLDYHLTLVMHGFATFMDRPYHLGSVLVTYPASRFAAQIKYLKKRFTMVQPDQPLLGIKGRTAAITFDDGYRCFATLAWPVLKKAGIKPLVFLPTESIESAEPLWFTKVTYFFEATDAPEIEIASRAYPLLNEGQKLFARTAMFKHLETLPISELRAESDRLWNSLPRLKRERFPRLMMTWEEVAKLRDEGVLWGSHTITHPFLSQMTAEGAEHELKFSRQVIEEKLQVPVTLLAYPEGSSKAISDATEQIALRHYQGAFTTVQRLTTRASSKAHLPRIGHRSMDSVYWLDLKINLALAREILAHAFTK